MAKKKEKVDTEADQDEETPEQLVIDVRTFTSPERLECQIHFDATFGELINVVKDAIYPNRTVAEVRVEGNNGRVFPDQVAQYMLWIQAKRDDPDAELEDFDDLNLQEVQSAFTRGLLGKAQRRTNAPKSPPESGSVDESQD